MLLALQSYSQSMLIWASVPTGFPLEERDFNITRIPLRFEAESAGVVRFIDIELVDDDVHEVEQVFVLFLQLVDAGGLDESDLQSGNFATLCRIADNDGK